MKPDGSAKHIISSSSSMSKKRKGRVNTCDWWVVIAHVSTHLNWIQHAMYPWEMSGNFKAVFSLCLCVQQPTRSPVCWSVWVCRRRSSLFSRSSWDFWILSFRQTMSQLESRDCRHIPHRVQIWLNSSFHVLLKRTDSTNYCSRKSSYRTCCLSRVPTTLGFSLSNDLILIFSVSI